jgi:hypothetical protein
MSSVGVFVRLSGKTLTDDKGCRANVVECRKGPTLTGEVHLR